jgi:transposase, IS5 family
MTTTLRHEQQTGKYRELIGFAEEVVDRARAALKHTRTAHGKDLISDPALDELRKEVERYCGLGRQVIDQTRRRVTRGRTYPA